jgi:FkbM family methyltransferase
MTNTLKIAVIDIIGIPYDGTTVFNQGLGGSESAVTLMSRELASLGHQITVFNNCNTDHAKPGIYDQVKYRPLTDLALPEIDNQFDIVVSSRTVIPFVHPNDYARLGDNRAWPYQSMNLYDRILASAKMRILWMHDTFCLGDLLIEELAVADRITDIFTLTDWHTTYITNCDHGRRRNFEVLKRKIFITRNGANSYIPEVDIAAKDPNLYVYNASVTKGMIPLVKHIWPRVKQLIPQAQLKIIGGYYRFSQNDEPDQQEKDWRIMANDPINTQLGIEFTGVIPQKDIAGILAKSSFMIYPCAFPETFGISTLESLLYNTPSITCRFGGLEEVALDGACYLIDYAVEPNGLFPNIDTPSQINKFVDVVVAAHHNRYLHQQKQYYCNIVKPYAGWNTVALQWHQHFLHKTGNYLPVEQYRAVSKINQAVHKIWNRRTNNIVELSNYKPNVEQEIVIISPFYNCAQYIERCIDSVAAQDYFNYHHILIDDCSTDGTFEKAQQKIVNLPQNLVTKFTLIKNVERVGAVKNQISAIKKIINKEAIIMLLDGDDSLVNDNTIFSYYNGVYDGTTEFTYGSCWSMVDNIPLISQPYPASVRENKTYRQHHFNWILPYTHLRTFKRFLLNAIDESQFKDADGNWYKAGGDGSVFYAFIEQADSNKIKCLQQIVYNYNDINPLNDYKVNGEEQNRTARDIIGKNMTKKLEKYSVIIPTMWRANEILIPFLYKLCACESVGEILVVNNDVSKTPDLAYDPKIKLFNFDSNIFVNPAWNFGVTISQFDRLCIANDDISFDTRVFEVLQDKLLESAGVFGLCPGDPIFNQTPVTTKTIDIIPWQGQNTHGFGCLMFINKLSWDKIPVGLDIYYGDNYIFDIQLERGKTNYLITNMDFYTPFASTTKDTTITNGVLEKESAIYQEVKNNMQGSKTLQNEFLEAVNTPSDINEHLPVLLNLANECQTVVEFGVRTGMSTRALLVSNCRLRSYDLILDPTVVSLFDLAKKSGKDVDYIQANSLEIDIDPVDMLFIDTDHHYAQLSKELNKHSNKVKKYIAFHDTYTYGLKSSPDDNKGLLGAILEFMSMNPEWRVKHYADNNNGFMVIERVEKEIVTLTVPEPVVNTAPKKRILIAIPTARNIEPDTFKSIYDLIIPDGYVVDFQYFFGYNIDQIRNLISDWIVNGYDYLFSVDSDISFNPDTLEKLLKHDVDVVSGLYIQRKPGLHILELYEHNGHGGVSNIPYEKIKGRGLVEIASCGFGCVLVKSQVMKAIGYPQFKYHSAINHANTVSEDVDFCRKALDKGFRLWADTTIQCRHTGSFTFQVDNNIPAIEDLKKKDNDFTDRLRELGNQRLLPKETVDYLTLLRDNGVVPKVIYDIGACVLHWTNEAEKIWPNSEYVMFEAMAETEFLYKERGFKYNLGPLSDVSGKTVDFYQNTYHPGGNSYYIENPLVNPQAPDYFNESHKRQMITAALDDVVKQRGFPLPDFIKMDVQGAELDILRGATETLKSVKHVILELQSVEYNTGAPQREEVIAYMSDLGFEFISQFTNAGPDGDYHFMRRM